MKRPAFLLIIDRGAAESCAAVLCWRTYFFASAQLINDSDEPRAHDAADRSCSRETHSKLICYYSSFHFQMCNEFVCNQITIIFTFDMLIE